MIRVLCACVRTCAWTHQLTTILFSSTIPVLLNLLIPFPIQGVKEERAHACFLNSKWIGLLTSGEPEGEFHPLLLLLLFVKEKTE